MVYCSTILKAKGQDMQPRAISFLDAPWSWCEGACWHTQRRSTLIAVAPADAHFGFGGLEAETVKKEPRHVLHRTLPGTDMLQCSRRLTYPPQGLDADIWAENSRH